MTAFIDYWRRLKGDRIAPNWREFKLTDLASYVIPNVVIADVVPGDPMDFMIRF
ncbi:MAG: hypothetical protein VW268_00550 [Rhodospirillaceae bacterium]